MSPAFNKGGTLNTTPFGKNQFLRSTQDVKKESYTVAKDSVPAVTFNGAAGQKILQPGMAMAKITSGPDIGKIGPVNSAATDGRQTAANIVGINTTFLPWQLIERDVEVAVAYECTAVQAWCFEYTGAATIATLTNTTADAMRGVKGLDIHFK